MVIGLSRLMQPHEILQPLLLFNEQAPIHFEQAIATRHQYLEVKRVLLGQGVPCPESLGQRLRNVERGMRSHYICDRPFFRVQIADRSRMTCGTDAGGQEAK